MTDLDREILHELEKAFVGLAIIMEFDGDDGSAVIRFDAAQADAFVKTVESIVVRRIVDDNHEGIIKMGLN